MLMLTLVSLSTAFLRSRSWRAARISETNGMSVVSGRRLTGFLAGLRRRVRVLCQPRSENCPGLPIFFGEADLKRPRRRRNNSFRDPVWCGEFLIEEVAKCSVPFE